VQGLGVPVPGASGLGRPGSSVPAAIAPGLDVSGACVPVSSMLGADVSTLGVPGLGVPGADVSGSGVLGPGMSGLDVPGVSALGTGMQGLGVPVSDVSGLEAPSLGVSGLDALGLDALGLDALGLDAPGLDAPGLDASGLGVPGSGAPGSGVPGSHSRSLGLPVLGTAVSGSAVDVVGGSPAERRGAMRPGVDRPYLGGDDQARATRTDGGPGAASRSTADRAEVGRAGSSRTLSDSSASAPRAGGVRPDSVVPGPRGMRRDHQGFAQAFGDVFEEGGRAEPMNDGDAGNARGPGSRRFWPTSGARGPEVVRVGLEPTGVDPRFREAAGPDARQVGSAADHIGASSGPPAGEQAVDLATSGGNRIGRQGHGLARDHAGATPAVVAEGGSAADAQLAPGGREGEARGGLALEGDGKTPAGGDARPAGGHGARRGRSFFRRFAAIEKLDEPASGRLEPVAPAAGPTEVRLVPLDSLGTVDGADDLRAASDRGGDPELDIDLDLDRVADADAGFDESGPDLHGLGVVDADISSYDRFGLGAVGIGDDDWLADEDARTALAEEAEDPEISGDFAVVDTAAAGTFPNPFDDFDASGWRQWEGRSDAYGDRVEGWIRPQYRDEPEPVSVSGDYWTPVPESSYGSGYGWPVPVARLPEVPPYPPASGFDVPAETESEPTAVVPQWPPVRPNDRIELPRSWSRHDEANHSEGLTPDDEAISYVAGVRGEMAALGDEVERRERAAFEESERQVAVDFDGVERRLGLALDGIELQVAGAFDGSGRRDGGEFIAETGHGNEACREDEQGAREAGRFRVEAGGPDKADTRDAERFRDPVVHLHGPPARNDGRADKYAAITGNDGGTGGMFRDSNARDGSAWGDDARDQSARDSGAQAGDAWAGGIGGGIAGDGTAPTSPVRGTARGYAARADSLAGPIWTVPELPETVLPDLSWAPEEAADDDGSRRVRRPAGMVRRRRPAPQGEDPTQALPSLDGADQPRVRPRPRPRPGNGQPDPRSTVYVSRHAAEPG